MFNVREKEEEEEEEGTMKRKRRADLSLLSTGRWGPTELLAPADGLWMLPKALEQAFWRRHPHWESTLGAEVQCLQDSRPRTA